MEFSTYLLINFAIIIFPLLFSFESKIKYYLNYWSLLFATITAGSFFIIWDFIAISRGDWWFSQNHIIGITLAGFPIEEILFFITVPYSCLFIYEAIIKFNKHNPKITNTSTLNLTLIVLGFLLIITSFVFIEKAYTFTAFFVAGLTLLLGLRFTTIFENKNYYLFLAITSGLFIVFNFLLTSIPIVNYSPKAILGILFITIPLEDFFFNFSMLTAYSVAYIFIKNKLTKTKSIRTAQNKLIKTKTIKTQHKAKTSTIQLLR